MSDEPLRKTGLSSLGEMPWGTHFCHFYETKQDLLDLIVPYFKVGLEDNEFCLCVNYPLLTDVELLSALRAAVPNFDRHLARRSIEIVAPDSWYMEDGRFDGLRAIAACKARLDEALRRGYAGMRLQANESWLAEGNWKSFLDYERRLNEAIVGLRMIVLCTYPLTRKAGEIFDVAHTHEFAVAKREGKWEVLETPSVKQAKAELLTEKTALERRVNEAEQELASATAESMHEAAERKRAQRRLRARDEKFRSLMEAVPVAVLDYDRDGLIEYFNPQAVALWGRVPLLRDRRDRYCGLFQLYRPDGIPLPPDRNPLAEALESGVAKLDEELIIERPDASRATVLASVVPLKDENGHVTGAVSCMMDITDRQRTEQRLHAREQEFRTIVENTPDQIYRYDRELRRTFVNPAAEAAYDVPKGSLVGRPAGFPVSPDAPWGAPEVVTMVRDSVKSVLASGEPREIEIPWPLPSGQRIFSVRLAPEFDRGGAVASVLAVARDITNLKAAEKALRQNQAEFARVARVNLVGELAASLAHELNQPLLGVVSNAEACLRWLEADPPNFDEARQALHRILRDGDRASNVVTRTRSLLNKGEPMQTRFKVDDLILETIALIKDETHRRHAALRTYIAPALPLITADRVQIQQVLLNLLMNSLDAVSEVAEQARQIDVRAEVRAEMKSDSTLQISIEDSGVGIDAQQVVRLFEAFYTTKPHGLGMGLSISRSIVEAHGGQIWMEPSKRGTKFIFTVPILGPPGS